MEKYITGNVATNLYWLGRYLERTETILREIASSYDNIIDIDKEAGVKMYVKYDIELSYTNAYDFLNQAVFGDHNANILNILTNVRENAIICRHLLDSEAFGEIIALHALYKDAYTNKLVVDYKCIDQSLSLIGQIWNAVLQREYQALSNSFLRLGKIVEDADFRLRRDKNDPAIKSIYKEIDSIMKRLTEETPSFQEPEVESRDVDDLLNDLNSKISQIVTG